MRWIDYREKLNIGFSDNEKKKMLANNIASFIENGGVSLDYTVDDYYEFCLTTGILYSEPRPETEGLYRLFAKTDLSIPQIISYYIAFVNTQTYATRPYKKNLIDILGDFLNDLNIQYEVFEDSDGYFVFPKGASELDSALVSQPLEWLKAYPSAHTAWIKAIREYANASDGNASDIADKFRKALETFFQEFFSGNKSLENFKAEYGKYLKKQGIPKEISGNFETLLQSYTQFINNYAKHRDATSDKVLEYIMYQTGNIIRLLITLKQEETTDAD